MTVALIFFTVPNELKTCVFWGNKVLMKIGFSPINWNRWAIFFGMSLFIMIVNFDMTTINLALVQISSDFNASVAGLSWILNGYFITIAISFVIAGRLSDRFGEPRVFWVGCLFLIGGSIVGGTAHSISILVLGRFIQGIGAGFGFSVAMLIVTQQFPKSKRGKAVAFAVTLGGLAQGIGPLIAASFLRQFGWASLFFFVAVVCFVVLMITFYTLKDENKLEGKEPFDFVGAILFIFGVMSLLIALNMLQSWSSHKLYLPTLAIGGSVSLLLLIRHIRETPYPLIRADLRANQSFLSVIMVRILAMSVWSALLFMLPNYLQNIRGMTVTSVGHILLLMTLTFGFISPFNGIWMDRVGSKLPCQVAMIISTIAFILLACTEIWQSDVLLYLGLFLFGLHSALIVSASIHATMETLSKKSQGSGMGVFYTISFSGATLGVVLSGAILSYVYADQLMAHVPGLVHQLSDEQLNNLRSGITSKDLSHLSDFSSLQLDQIRDTLHYALSQGFVRVMSVCAGLSFIGFLFSRGLKSNQE